MVWEVFPQKPVASKRRKKDSDDDDTDDDGPEAFQRRKSKWERLGWRDVHDDQHWIKMSTTHAARGPTMVFTFWLQKVVNGVAIQENCVAPRSKHHTDPEARLLGEGAGLRCRVR